MSEVLKSCKRCEQLPKFSSYAFDFRESAAVVCCTTISGKTKDEAIYKWNLFNIEAKNTFKFNNMNQKWELVAKNEPTTPQ